MGGRLFGAGRREAQSKRQVLVWSWRRWEKGEPRQVMRGDRGSEVRLEISIQCGSQRRTTPGAWAAEGHDEIGDLVRLLGQWCVQWTGGRREWMKGIVFGVRVCAKPRSSQFYSFWGLRKSEMPEYGQEHELVLFNITQPNFGSCPHPATPTPDNSVYRSTRKWLWGIVWEGCCNRTKLQKMQMMEKVLALHKHITTFSSIQRHLSHFLRKLYLALFQFRVAFLLS